LVEKFDQGLRKGTDRKRWTPQEVATLIQNFKEDGKFWFSVDEFLKPSQIRSYFARLKAKRQGVKNTDLQTIEISDTDKAFKNYAAEEEELLYNTLKVLVLKNFLRYKYLLILLLL
jgi:hypothetical protein